MLLMLLNQCFCCCLISASALVKSAAFTAVFSMLLMLLSDNNDIWFKCNILLNCMIRNVCKSVYLRRWFECKVFTENKMTKQNHI